MGRYTYSDKRLIEDCKSIPIKILKAKGYFKDAGSHGRLSWSCREKETGNIGFYLSIVDNNPYLRLYYLHTNRKGEKTEVDYKISLVSTPCHYGGKRWWFICPLAVNGVYCGRRVGVLYLSSGKYFGCRHCHNLTYRSCKENHKSDRIYRMIGVTPQQAKRIFKGEI